MLRIKKRKLVTTMQRLKIHGRNTLKNCSIDAKGHNRTHLDGMGGGRRNL